MNKNKNVKNKRSFFGRGSVGMVKAMNAAQTTALVFALGILAVLVLAGCSDPAMGSLSQAAMEENQAAKYGSETITLYLSAEEEEEEDGSRSAAGLEPTRIQMTNIRNFVQIVVLDKEAGTIASVAEARKKNVNDTVTALRVNRLKKGRVYHILLLQGHWNYTGTDSNSEYVYDATPPTLLAAGYKAGTESIPSTGTLSVEIDLDPIWIDTKFSTSASGVPNALKSVEPPTVITAGGAKVVTTTGLVPVSNWKVAFTVYLDEANSTKNGFADLLAAQAAGGGATSLLALQTGWPVLWIKDPGASTLSKINNPGNLVRGGADDNVFTYTIPAAYTNGMERDGTEGYINFNLNYTPVAKTAAANWQSASGKALSKFFTVPQWIIRNGVNDNPQNAYTNFEDGNLPSGGAAGLNWNGSVPFTVAYVRGTPPDGWTGGTIDPDGYDPTWRDPNFPNYQPPKLFLSDGVWDKIDASGTPAIGTVSFKADGTFDSAAPAQWYYTVKVSEDPPVTPSISAYFAPKSLVNLTVKGDQTRSFPFPISYASGQNYDAWVIAVKDYVVSKPLFISGAEGNLNITWGWGN